ncbi:NACHT domain-containing protein [Actinoplanes auranticolor]|uniref:NACHT domain-containing protein n=1 Tax=Actinoplanes auranticolor TaxID=47988 RepID=A0A919STD2_9ACTN|nr:NACHT domain-containing protein [Actinoplanes auranticolor]GIM77579.1 hypothetical protein Aau02nite_76540 [Actinoplanes auranticolor]
MRGPLFRRIGIAAVLTTTAILLAVLGVLLERLGLERADQLSSVLALFVGVLGLGAALVALRQDRSPKGPTRARSRLPTAWGKIPLREDVRRLLEATGAAANRSPNRLLGSRQTNVSTVYVQQRVEQPQHTGTPAGDKRRQRRKYLDDMLFLPFAQQPRVIPVRRPLEKVFDQHRHLLIEGGPGSGKSTTAGQVCRQLAAAWLSAEPDGARLTAKPLLPLLVTARALAQHILADWPEALAAAASEGLGLSRSAAIDPELLRDKVDGVEWLIVVDGLDEVPTDERDSFLDRLSAWTSSTDRPYRLLITTRPLTGHATSLLGAGSIGHYTLLPFDRRTLGVFARRWFSNDENGADLAAGFLAQVTGAGLHDVASVPLMATIAITVYDSDPVAGLPRNRHDLYERYLRWLQQRDTQRRATAWSKLAAALHAEPAEALIDRADDLLEELALTRVESRRSLVLTAIDWLRCEYGPVGGRPPEDLGRIVAEALVSTGLLSSRDAGPDFIHLTFAEHFAARRYAAQLPEPFVAQDTAWRHWLHRAVREDPVAIAVLSRWVREHPAGDLVTWLLDGVHAHRLVVIRLVAEGALVDDSQLAECLSAMERELWGDPRYYSDKILMLVRRFQPSALLTAWMSRQFSIAVEGSPAWAGLAVVLADHDPDRRASLVTALRTVALTADGLGERLAAAVALDEVTPEPVETVTRSLAAALSNRTGSDTDRMGAATYLAEVDGEPHNAAVRAMKHILQDVSADLSDRRTAAEALAEWDGDARKLILAELTRALRSPAASPFSKVSVAQAMVAVAPESRSEVAVWARGMLARSDVPPRARIMAARALAEWGPDDRALVIHRLREISGELTTNPGDQVEAALSLVRLGEDCWPDAISMVCAALRQAAPVVSLAGFRGTDREFQNRLVRAIAVLAGEPSTTPETAQSIRSAAIGLDPMFQEDVDAALATLCGPTVAVKDLPLLLGLAKDGSPEVARTTAARIADWLDDDDVDLDTFLVVNVAATLGDFGPDQAAAATSALQRVMVDVSLPHPTRAYAARHLVSRPQFSAEAAAVMLLAWTDDTTHYAGVAELEELLAYPAHRRAAVEALDSCLGNPHSFPWDRLDAVDPLAKQAATPVPELMDRLRLLFVDRTHRPVDRRWIAVKLLSRGPDDQAVAALAALATDPLTPADVRADAAFWFVENERDNTGEFHALMVEITLDACVPVGDRAAVLRDLFEAGSSEVRLAEAVVSELPWAEAGMQIFAVGDFLPRAVAEVSTGLSHTVGDYLLRSIAHLPDRPLPAPFRSLLGRLAGCTDALHDVLADATPCVRLVKTAGAVLSFEDPSVGAALRHLLQDPRTPPADRRTALQLQLDHVRAQRLPAVEMLITALASRAGRQTPAIDRITAAELLYRLVEHRRAAGAALTAVLADEAESTTCRQAAAQALAQGGPRGRRAAAQWFASRAADEGSSVAQRCRAAEDRNYCSADSVVEVCEKLLKLGASATAHRDIVEALTTVLTIDPADETALARLQSLASDPDVPAPVFTFVCDRLMGGTPVHRRGAAQVLEERLQSREWPVSHRIVLHGLLARVVPDAKPAAVAALSAVGHDPAQPPVLRARAAALLCGLEAAAAVRTGQELLRMVLGDPAVPAYIRVFAGEVSLRYPGPFRREVRDALLSLGADPDDRLAAAVTVLRADGPEPAVRLDDQREPAGPAVGRLLTSPGLAPHAVLAAAVVLGEIGDPTDRTTAARALRRLANDGLVHPYVRFRALAALPQVDFSDAKVCTKQLWAAVDDACAPLDQRRWAAEALANLSDAHRRPARDALRSLDGGRLDGRTGRRLRRSIAYVDSGDYWIGRPLT